MAKQYFEAEGTEGPHAVDNTFGRTGRYGRRMKRNHARDSDHSVHALVS